MRNIHNVVSDVQEKISADHFPVRGDVLATQGEWTIVEFTTVTNNILQFEVNLGQQVSCVLEQIGFTNDQRDTIMEVFTQMMFD